MKWHGRAGHLGGRGELFVTHGNGFVDEALADAIGCVSSVCSVFVFVSTFSSLVAFPLCLCRRMPTLH